MTFQASRREFLRHATRLSALGAAAPLALQLSAMSSASAMAGDSTYKALVCVFLYGGNDPHNTIIPVDTASYDRYYSARSQVAVPLNKLDTMTLNPTTGWGDGRGFAFNPALTSLKDVFDNGQLTLLMNVGTLLQPTTVDDYHNGRNLPPKLMSHNDQFSIWQSLADEGATNGWGGRLGDLLAAQNGANSMFTNMTVGASATFSSGLHSNEFLVGTAGGVGLKNLTDLSGSAEVMHSGLTRASDHLIKQELAIRAERAITGASVLADGLKDIPNYPMPNTTLGQQLAMVARLIAAQQNMGMQRQVFFVSLGGFDSHDSLLDTHPALLAQLGDALAKFQGVINDMGMANQVTTFTASDFGRALTSNATNGSDHGWGSHHFVMGGAVNPKSWVGALPSLQLGAADDIGQGRLLPAVAVDQYGAALARWMGVTDTGALNTIFPNLANFGATDLALMAPVVPAAKAAANTAAHAKG